MLVHPCACIHVCVLCVSPFLPFYVGSDATVGAPPVIPPIKAYYVDIQRLFVEVCTTQGSPTLEEVKDLCIDVIQGALRYSPVITCQQSSITQAETMKELARILCFDLSNWVNYEFFALVVATFQPALVRVADRLRHYGEELKHVLVQKLEFIAKINQR